MALNPFKCNYLTPLHFKWLRINPATIFSSNYCRQLLSLSRYKVAVVTVKELRSVITICCNIYRVCVIKVIKLLAKMFDFLSVRPLCYTVNSLPHCSIMNDRAVMADADETKLSCLVRVGGVNLLCGIGCRLQLATLLL